MTAIYKICTAAQWKQAQQTGVFHGAPVDLADGFIHFSTAGQVAETAQRHFAGITGLMLLSVDATASKPRCAGSHRAAALCFRISMAIFPSQRWPRTGLCRLAWTENTFFRI